MNTLLKIIGACAIGAVAVFSVASIANAQAAVCDTEFQGNRIHACYFYWPGGGPDRVPPDGRSRPYSQEDFTIPENVGSYAVFDFNGGRVWSWSRWKYEQVNIRNTRRPFSTSGIWRGAVKFRAGTYTFRTISDDGVELFIDGQQKISRWNDHGDTLDSARVTFTEPGWHTIQLKWYQGGGGARLKFWWDYTPASCDASFSQNKLHACFYEWGEGDQNKVGAVPSALVGQGDITISENTEQYVPIDYSNSWEWNCRWFADRNHWCRWEQKEIKGSGGVKQSGSYGVAERYAGVWRGKVKLKAGSYDFQTFSDDGVELIIDGRRQIDRWNDHGEAWDKATVVFDTEGWHDIQLKWYQGGGGARLKFWWDNYKPLCDTTFKDNTLHACFFEHNNYDDIPTGATPVVAQWDERQLGSANSAIESEEAFKYQPSYNQAVGNSGKALYVGGIWRGRINFKGGRYIFHTLSDDGVDVRIDDAEVIRNWTIHGDTENTKEIKLTQGYHNVQLKWFQNWGGATIRFWWERLNDPPTLDIVEPKEAYILVNPQEVSDRNPKQYPLYVRSSDPDSGRYPKVTFVIRDSQNRRLLNTTVQEPNSNGASRTAARFGDRYRFYAPAIDFRSGDASRLRSAPEGLGIQIMQPGVYIFDVSSKDDQGAVTAKSTKVTVNQAPQFMRVSSSNPLFTKKTTDTSTVTVEADVTDEDGISSVTIQKDSDTPVAASRVGSSDTYRATFTLSVRDASYVFTVKATDANPVKQETAQNGQGISITVRKENESPGKPRFAIPGVPSGQKHFWLPKDKDMFVASVSDLTDPDDNISRVSLMIDGNEVDYKNGSEIRDGKVTLQWKDPTDGKHTVNVRVVDYGAPRSFTVDGDSKSEEWNTTPDVSFFPRPASYEYGETVSLGARATDSDGIEKVEYFEGGTLIGTGARGSGRGASTYVVQWTGDKDPGRHSVRVVATDTRGGVASAPNEYAFDVKKPPIPQLSTINIKGRDGDGVVLSNLATRKQTIGVSIVFDITAPTTATLNGKIMGGPDRSRKIVSLDSAIAKGAASGTLTFPDISEGAYRLNLTLTDKYGTQSTGTIDFTIVKPNEPPVIDSWTIEGVRGNTHTVTRPDKYTLIATAYDPDPTQPILTLFRNDEVFSASPTITAKTTSSGKSGYEYRYVFEAREKGTFNYTVQASDGKLSSDATSPLSITMNNAIPTVTRVEPKRTLTTDPVVPVYADARDPDGSVRDVTFTVYDSGNKRVFSALSPSKDYAPPEQGGRGGFSDRNRYYAPAPYRAQIGGGRAFAQSSRDFGSLRFPSPGVYTLVITSRDNDGAYSREDRTTVTINDVPVATGFKVIEGAEVLTPVGSARARITFEAQTRDDVGGIANVALYNVQNEKVADLSKTGDNVYRHTLDLDARTGDYQFFVEPKDVHGEVGRRIGVQVKITKSNTVKLFSSSTRVPGHQSGTYYIIPTEQVRFGFNDAFDNVRDPVEFFIRDQKIQTRKVQDNPPVYEWTNPSYGTHEVSAKLPHASVVEQTPAASFTVYDAIQTRDETASATSFAAPYIHSIKTKTPRNGLVTVSGANGSVPITVIARSKGSKIRAMRVFERGKSAEGITIQIPSADRNFGNEHTRDFTFPGLAEGVHTFIAKVMDEVGEVSEERVLTVFVAQAGNQEVISSYEDFYGLNNARAVTNRPSASAVILKESKTTTGLPERPTILSTEAANPQKVLKTYPKENAQPQNVERRGVLDILRAIWNFIIRKN